ncbi:MAG: hypothetical protein AAF404_23300, partial [Pseudomonadota bacterium]
MSTSTKHLKQLLVSLSTLFAVAGSAPAIADFFDQFRLIGDHSGVSTGFVSSIDFDKTQARASIQFLNVAGGTEELTVALSASQSISTNLPVFLPPPAFLQPPPASLDLAEVELLQGTIVLGSDQVIPPHWFRLTYFDNRWSGTFRIDNRIYSIDRYTDDDTVTVAYRAHRDRVIIGASIRLIDT